MNALVALLVVCILSFDHASAHVGATGIVKQRMHMMEELGARMKELSEMLRDPDRFDASTAQRAADRIAAHGGDAMTRLFPHGSTEKPSEALPEIWANWDQFAAIARELETSAHEFGVALDREPTMFPKRQFSKLAQTCSACHKDFRATKDR